jgi:PhoH-like ATPase
MIANQNKNISELPLPAEVKHRVLDTSAIVHDPAILLAYGGDHIYINLSVLEECDELKDRRDKAVSQEARKAIREIETIINGHDGEELQTGILMPNGRGVLHIFIDTDIELDSRVPMIKGNEVDNRLINTSLHLAKTLVNTVLVSRDINLRLKARALGVASEDVPDDVAVQDLDLMWPGYVELEGDVFTDIKDPASFALQSPGTSNSGAVYKLPKAIFGRHAQRNLYWTDDAGQAGRIIGANDNTVSVELINGWMRSRIWGIEPRSNRQAVAINQLIDDRFDLNILLGPAGTGKTLLAMAAALHMVMEEKRYKRIICVRSRDFMDDEPGYLPGDLDAKVRPLLAGVLDALYTLHDGDESPQGSMDYIIERAQIEFTSMAYMRGRSLSDAVVIIDEAQNMTKQQMRGMLSRSGSNSRTIVLGNTRQIDNPFLTPLTSGLASAVNTYRNYEGGSVIVMNEVERSPLAAFTEEHF